MIGVNGFDAWLNRVFSCFSLAYDMSQRILDYLRSEAVCFQLNQISSGFHHGRDWAAMCFL